MSPKDLIEASQQNPQQGNKNPAVVFVFFDGIIKNVSGMAGCLCGFLLVCFTDALTRMGVIVIGQEFDKDDTNQTDSPLEIAQMMKGIATVGNHMKQELMEILHVAPPTRSVLIIRKILFCHTIYCHRISLDVSSMIAWVSGLTHGGAMLHYQVVS